MDVRPVAAARLHHVHVLAAHVLQQLHARLLVGELGESASKVGNCRLAGGAKNTPQRSTKVQIYALLLFVYL